MLQAAIVHVGAPDIVSMRLLVGLPDPTEETVFAESHVVLTVCNTTMAVIAINVYMISRVVHLKHAHAWLKDYHQIRCLIRISSIMNVHDAFIFVGSKVFPHFPEKLEYYRSVTLTCFTKTPSCRRLYCEL
jgi:hypothetical protein